MKSIGIFVPSYNGGKKLLTTINSLLTLKAKLSAKLSIKIIIVDNESTDGSIENISQKEDIYIIRNEYNIGRVENWNKCVDLANTYNCDFYTYCFVGDKFHNYNNFFKTIESLNSSDNIIMSISTYDIKNASNNLYRKARCLSINDKIVSCEDIILSSLNNGFLCMGPLQANIYRRDIFLKLNFSSDNPTHTDQEEMYRILLEHRKEQIYYCSKSYFSWIKDENRTHSSINSEHFIKQDLSILNDISNESNHELNYKNFVVNNILRRIRSFSQLKFILQILDGNFSIFDLIPSFFHLLFKVFMYKFRGLNYL